MPMKKPYPLIYLLTVNIFFLACKRTIKENVAQSEKSHQKLL